MNFYSRFFFFKMKLAIFCPFQGNFEGKIPYTAAYPRTPWTTKKTPAWINPNLVNRSPPELDWKLIIWRWIWSGWGSQPLSFYELLIVIEGLADWPDYGISCVDIWMQRNCYLILGCLFLFRIHGWMKRGGGEEREGRREGGGEGGRRTWFVPSGGGHFGIHQVTTDRSGRNLSLPDRRLMNVSLILPLFISDCFWPRSAPFSSMTMKIGSEGPTKDRKRTAKNNPQRWINK